MRVNDFGQFEYGKEPTWEALRDAIYERDGVNIANDERLNELFDRLLPDYRDEYPSGSTEAVDRYAFDAFAELQDYLDESENYGDYNLADFYDWEGWGDWRANYDDAA